MLEIIVKLVPYGQKDLEYEIGTLTIINDGKGSYKFFLKEDNLPEKIVGKIESSGKSCRHRPVFQLIKEVLDTIIFI